MPGHVRRGLVDLLALLLVGFTLFEVNYPHLAPQSQLAVFAGLGLTSCFLLYPLRAPGRLGPRVDALLSMVTLVCCGYLVFQSEPLFEPWWVGGRSLGDRAGAATTLDVLVGGLGVLLVLEASRRAVGLALPLLAIAFLAYGFAGPLFPAWLFPHRGYPLDRLISQSFLHGQGVFGIALDVMFSYVFLFVVFGALLEVTGATEFVIESAKQAFRRSSGGSAKIAVLSSGLIGSLSGSAVANTATTGTFTIPMMRSSGLPPHIAAGITAAASSGGALVPPVMGAGAYMMLEIVQPPVSYLEIIRAALLPAILYYLSLFLIVHFYARRVGSMQSTPSSSQAPIARYEGILFLASLGSLLTFLIMGFTVFRSVSLALAVIIPLSFFRSRTRLTTERARIAVMKTSRGGVPLIAAAACVGIIIGVVILTGVGTKLPALIIPLAEQNLLFALILIMVSSLILGMGLPSAVCYLLLATLIGPVIGDLGVPPLAAHFFIFYFGMMSMVTPPVALAAYAAASIAGSDILRSSFAAFRFALVGFSLPFMFVFRPELLLIGPGGRAPGWAAVGYAVLVAVLGILSLAAALAGQLRTRLSAPMRGLLFLAAALLLYPGADSLLSGYRLTMFDLGGAGVLAAVSLVQWRRFSIARPVLD